MELEKLNEILNQKIEETPLPKKNENLFIEGKNQQKLSYIGWGNMPTQMFGYIEGYKKSADLLINNAIQEGDNSILDTVIFPACFLYRQYLELKLKAIIVFLSGNNKEECIRIIKKVGHDLLMSWDEVKNLIEQYFSNSELDIINIKYAEKYIKEFNKEDQQSMSFRYPFNRKIDAFHKKPRNIDLENLKLRMNELYNFMDLIEAKIEDQLLLEQEYYEKMMEEIEEEYKNEMYTYY